MTPSRGAVHWNPLRLDGTALPETLLLAARLLAIVVAIGGYWPFERGVVMFEFLGQLGSVDQFTTALRLGTSVGVVILLFTQWVRVGAALIGTTILIGLVGALGAHSVAHTYLGAFFVIVSLSSRRVGSELLRLQLVVLYGAATLQKVLDVSWWNGDYFHTFLVVRHELLWFDYPWVLLAMGVGTILAELTLTVLFAIERTRVLAVRLAVLFHGSIEIISGVKFGPFVPALLATFLAVGREGKNDRHRLLHPAFLLLVTILLTARHGQGWLSTATQAILVLVVTLPLLSLKLRKGNAVPPQNAQGNEGKRMP